MELESVFFGMDDPDVECEIDSNIAYDNSFSHSLDDLVPAWEDSFFGLGNGVVDDEITDTFANSESPSHESDSGMSSLGSPETVDTDASEEFILADLLPAKHEGMFDEQMDEDLFSYLADSPSITQFPVSPAASENENVDDTLSDSEEGTSDVSRLMSQVKKTVDVNMNITSFHPVGYARKLKDSTRLFKKAATEKLPETVEKKPTLFRNVDAVKPTCNTPVVSRLPTVKVVRLVTPVGSQSGNIPSTQDLVHAFEDKNRKNADQAKINRDRKKKYIKGLEDQIEMLTSENQTLKTTAKSFDSERDLLNQEVVYLKSVLANQSSLSNLLKNIPSVKNVKLSSSFMSRKRSTEHDHDYESEAKKWKGPKLSGGVCLHVDKDSVSLEFCSNCAKMASRCCEGD